MHRAVFSTFCSVGLYYSGLGGGRWPVVVRDVSATNYISSLHLIFSARVTGARTLIGRRSIEFTSSLGARLAIGCDAGAVTS